MLLKKILTGLILLFTLFTLNTVKTFAQNNISYSEELLEAKIIQILDEKKSINPETKTTQINQKLKLIITKGSLKGKEVIIETATNNLAYKQNDQVIVSYTKTPDGKDFFYIVDYVRRGYLLLLFLAFVIITILITRKKGIASLLGMTFSFFIIFKFMLPKILAGEDPIQTAITTAIIITPITFSISHGLNKKTLSAILGTISALIITGILAAISIQLTKLSGFSSEEANLLQIYNPAISNIKGLLFGGIIISLLGILDDVTVSQASIIYQLKEANPKLTFSELYKKGLEIGKDHISATVNTLVLVYAGTSMPLLLIFLNTPYSFTQLINYEIIAEEIVRTLVSSMGLIIAVPITNLITTLAVTKEK